MEQQTILVDGHEVDISNWSKVLWPETGFTKGDLVRYYSQAAPYLLPHLRDRPLTVTRFPHGIQGAWFYQKNCPQYAPDFVETIAVTSDKDKPEKTINYILVQNRPTLVWLANQACIELHPWLSLYTRPQYPDWLVFDLDPAEGSTFDDTREIAFLVRKALSELGLSSHPKLSGATGIHGWLSTEAGGFMLTTCKTSWARLWLHPIAPVHSPTLPFLHLSLGRSLRVSTLTNSTSVTF